MKIVTKEEFFKLPIEDTVPLIEFSFRGAKVKTFGHGMYSTFHCDDRNITDYLAAEHLLFYLDNKHLYQPSSDSGAKPDKNPTLHEMMVRFVKDRLGVTDFKIIPPKFGIEESANFDKVY